ncbi:MAG: CBS domain-containing protein [Desulfovibrionaceae bacterium]|nr:CBS domain-containing protein [Desulfovibrionaceae bacterium]
MDRYFKVKDLMVPVSDMHSIESSASFEEAINALGVALQEFRAGKRQSPVLIVTEQGKMVAKLSPTDVLRSMEPAGEDVHEGASVQVEKFDYIIDKLREAAKLSSSPWDNLMDTARNKKVADIMRRPNSKQIINLEDGLNEAIHRFVLSHNNNLFVTDGHNNLVGVLDMASLYAAAVDKLKDELNK